VDTCLCVFVCVCVYVCVCVCVASTYLGNDRLRIQLREVSLLWPRPTTPHVTALDICVVCCGKGKALFQTRCQFLLVHNKKMGKLKGGKMMPSTSTQRKQEEQLATRELKGGSLPVMSPPPPHLWHLERLVWSFLHLQPKQVREVRQGDTHISTHMSTHKQILT
jgi:hypothetical protein